MRDKVGYEFPQGSVHEHMAKFYGVDYEEAKDYLFNIYMDIYHKM